MIPEVRIEAEALVNDFKINEIALREFMKGPVEQNLVQRAIRVEAAAKQYATGQGGGPQVRTGRLRASITWRVGYDAVSPYVDIGTAVEYAPYVELGHKNHAHAYPIVTPGGKFTGRYGFVSNRPTKAFPFLRPALQAARTT